MVRPAPEMKLPRWYPILDTNALQRLNCDVLTAVEGLLEGGARIIQLRHKGTWTALLLRDARQAAAMCAQADALLVINDRADIAALSDAALHVGQEDLPPEDARNVIGTARVLGLSTHNESQLKAGDGEPVDYLALGPIFGTTNKENPDPVVGLEELTRLRAFTSKPLVAIGGITRESAATVLAAGADSVAVIGDACPRDGAKASWRLRAEEWVTATHG
jgi:thiamine-phosphate pyrophosphorylase